jgi:PAS domain S-box-containing protein
LVHPDDHAENSKLIERLLSGEIPHFIFENRYVRKGGEVVWGRKSVSLVHDDQGRPQWIIALVENITERKRTEDSLAESLGQIERGEFTLNTLMETVPDGITIADAQDVRILKVSRYGRELLSRSPAELEDITVEEHAQRWNIYELDGTSLAKNEHLPLTRAVQKGEIVRNEEWVLGHPDGHRIPILCNAAPIINGSEKIIGGVIAWRDVTDLKKMEAELRRSNQELNEYTHALTHNVKAPFRAVQNYANFLLEDLADTLDGEPKQFLDGIKKAVGLANQQFEDLEALYKVKNHPLKFEALDMRDLLGEIATLRDGTQDYEIVTEKQWPTLNGQRFLLRQILMALVSNGFKYNRSDRKRVEVSWRHPSDGRFEIVVRDNGIGIDPQYHENIFHIFKRLHTEEEYKGTGIGLAITRRALQRIGGELRVESAVGEGTTFVISLPAAMVEEGGQS